MRFVQYTLDGLKVRPTPHPEAPSPRGAFDVMSGGHFDYGQAKVDLTPRLAADARAWGVLAGISHSLLMFRLWKRPLGCYRQHPGDWFDLLARGPINK